MSNYIFQSRDARGITFESPLDVNSTLRFSRTVGPKTVDGLKLTNVRSDTVVVRQVDPRSGDCQDCTSVAEALSVRIIVSGSTASASKLESALATVIKAVWDNRTTLLRGSLPSDTSAIAIDPPISIEITP